MKKYLILALIVLVVGALFIGVLAEKPGNVPHQPAGGSNIAHAYLYEKVPSGDWPILEGGAWGKMTYNQSGSTFDFVFNGHGLEPGRDYTLIYYPDITGNPWPRVGIICLGSGTADGDGDVHIMDSVETGDLPTGADINLEAKIWLVLSSDVDCSVPQIAGWTPTEYLFEYDLITFEYIED
jgi:hypothetical protein